MMLICNKIDATCKVCHPYCDHNEPHEYRHDCDLASCSHKNGLRPGTVCIQYENQYALPEELFEI